MLRMRPGRKQGGASFDVFAQFPATYLARPDFRTHAREALTGLSTPAGKVELSAAYHIRQFLTAHPQAEQVPKEDWPSLIADLHDLGIQLSGPHAPPGFRGTIARGWVVLESDIERHWADDQRLYKFYVTLDGPVGERHRALSYLPGLLHELASLQVPGGIGMKFETSRERLERNSDNLMIYFAEPTAAAGIRVAVERSGMPRACRASLGRTDFGMDVEFPKTPDTTIVAQRVAERLRAPGTTERLASLLSRGDEASAFALVAGEIADGYRERAAELSNILGVPAAMRLPQGKMPEVESIHAPRQGSFAF